MTPILNILLVLVLVTLQGCYGARILFYIGGVSSHSHRSSVQPLANALAEKGHSVTFISPHKNPGSHSNISEFCPTELKEFNKVLLHQFGVVGFKMRLEKRHTNEIATGTTLSDLGYTGCLMTFTSPEFLPWLEKQAKFDLVFIDNVGNECAFGIAEYFDAKKIIFSPISSLMPWDTEVFGLPSESSWLPNIDMNYDEPSMGYWQRWRNTLDTIERGWMYHHYHLPRMEQLVRDTIPGADNMTSLLDVVRSTNLMFLNQHYSDLFPRSYPPFVVPVGGLHIEKGGNPLPKDLEDFIQGAGESGFVYISFGSAIDISTVPEHVLQYFFDAIKDLNTRFLWKWDAEPPSNAPKNVLFKKWFPQIDVLTHKKIKGYVMQGGQISFQQAICYAVPVIIFPVNGDQDMAAKFVRQNGNGLEMEFADLNAQVLRRSLEKLIGDPRIKQRTEFMSRVCKDRPMTPLQTAVWWTEYVLRMESTDHLKPGSMYQAWWVYRSLDVLGVIIAGLTIGFLILLVIAYKMYRWVTKASIKLKQH